MFTKNVTNFVKGFWETKFGDKKKRALTIEFSLKNFDLLSFSGVQIIISICMKNIQMRSLKEKIKCFLLLRT
jgi:hypothetical protein